MSDSFSLPLTGAVEKLRPHAWMMVAVLGAITACNEAQEPAAPRAETIEPRVALSKSVPLMRQVPDGELAQLVVKFNEGTAVRLGPAGLVHTAQPGAVLPVSAGVRSAVALQEQLLRVDRAVRGANVELQRTFTMPDAQLAALKRQGERRTGRQLADLSLYFSIPASEFASLAAMEEVRDALNALDVVEGAYIQSKPVPAQTADPLPPDANTPDFTPLQSYTDPAPLGVDADYASTIPGGRGAGIEFVDIEGGWLTTHEDFPPIAFSSGTYNTDWIDHGTAVVGVVAGVDNDFGVTGIAADATVGVSSIFGIASGTAEAITIAANQAGPGGVILIEVHYGGPYTVDCTCNHGQCNYIAVEYFPAEFDAITTATANGITVIEAAGNGSVDLDHPTYGGSFNRQQRDSGAILVGASLSSGRTPTCWTNHGSRVDIHGWGENVVTLGDGGLYSGTLGEDDRYSNVFAGTSSGSAILAGVATAMQGAALENLGQPLTPVQLRALLTATGTPQTGEFEVPIGPLPDMRAAIDTLLDGAPIPDFQVSCIADVCDFTDISHDLDGTITAWSWNFGDSTTASGAQAQHTYAQSGLHTVTLTVTDDSAQTRALSRTVVVELPVVCGDAVCDATETCSSCASDCGECTSACTCPSGCESVVSASVPFQQDGVANTCYFFGSLGGYVNSWNTAEVNVNGVDVTNQYVPSNAYPSVVDGGYYLYVRGDFPWSHVESM